MKKAVGIYIGRKEVIAACVVKSGKSFFLESFSRQRISEVGVVQEPASAPKASPQSGKKGKHGQPLNEQAPPESIAIHEALKGVQANTKTATIAFNPFNLVTRYYQIPYVPPREWQAAARYEASRYIPFKLDETVSDFRIQKKMEADRMTLEITCAAAKHSTLRSYLDQLHEASVRAHMIEPIFSGFARALAAGPGGLKDETYGLIFMDAGESVNITLAHGGMVYLSRDFLLSGEEQADQTRFYEELKLSFDYMRQASSDKKIGRIFIAGSGELGPWQEFLSGAFGGGTEFVMGSFAAKQPVPQDAMSALLIPIGLALHGLHLASPLGDLALLPPAEVESKPERIKKSIEIQFLLIAVVFLFLRFVVLGPYERQAEQVMRGRMDPAVAGSPLLREPLENLKSKHQTLKDKVNILEAFFKGKIAVSAKLKSLARRLPSQIWLEQITFTGPVPPDAGQITFRGQCYAGNAEEDVKIINRWVQESNGDKDFMEGLQRLNAREVRREKYLDQDTTMFWVASQEAKA